MAEAVARKNWWKMALVAVVAIELLGGLSGWLSNSGYGNGWFDGLQKPSFMEGLSLRTKTRQWRRSQMSGMGRE